MPSMESHQGSLVHNQNLMQAKFHANKYQDNLLSKRLQQLNTEEMKTRLKYQRSSNELILFLRECQKTTGYFSKMKSFQSNSFVFNDDDQKEFKISKSTFESKSSLDMGHTTKIRSSSYSNQGRCMKDFEAQKQKKKYSLYESQLKNSNIIKQPFNIRNSSSNGNNKVLFERILNSSGDSSPRNSSSSRSQLTTSSKISTPECKQLLSGRSSSTSLSSNSSESFEIFKNCEKKIRPITSQVDRRPVIKRFDENKFSHESTRSHIEWVGTSINLDLDCLSKNKLLCIKNEDSMSRKSSTSSSTNATTESKTTLSSFKKSEFILPRFRQ